MRFFPEMGKISPQHQTSTTLSPTCGGNRATPAFPCSRLCSPTSTPKPRAEGSSPSAPAKNSATAFAVALFFVMAVGETEARGACRASPPKRRLWRMQRGGDGAAVGDWQGGPAAADRAGYRKRACEASSSPSFHFCHVMEELPSLSLLYSVLSHPTSPVLNLPHPLQHPEHTRFRPFWGWTGCGPLFLSFFACKIYGPVFVHCADMSHRLKPSVMPCRRALPFPT